MPPSVVTWAPAASVGWRQGTAAAAAAAVMEGSQEGRGARVHDEAVLAVQVEDEVVLRSRRFAQVLYVV